MKLKHKALSMILAAVMAFTLAVSLTACDNTQLNEFSRALENIDAKSVTTENSVKDLSSDIEKLTAKITELQSVIDKMNEKPEEEQIVESPLALDYADESYEKIK